MKVLVATHISQGDDTADYCWTVDGELVSPLGVVCSDPGCGCDRGFSGFASSRATTTAMVVELPHIAEPGLSNAIRDSLQRVGWFDGVSDQAKCDMTNATFEAIQDVVAAFPVGTIVCREGDDIYARFSLAA